MRAQFRYDLVLKIPRERAEPELLNLTRFSAFRQAPEPEDTRLNGSRMFCHTVSVVQKIAVTLDRRAVADLDRWVKEGKYPNRSRALQSAVDLLSEREKRTRLVRELAKLDPKEEEQLAEEGLGDAWPAY